MPIGLVPILLSLTLCLCGSDSPSTGAQTATASRALSADQVRRLLDNRTPDAAIANEIDERGVNFLIDDSLTRELAKAGAGAQVLAALRRRQPKGIGIIRAGEPGATVFIDGTEVGSTGEDGTLRVELLVGTRELLVQKGEHLRSEKVALSVNPSAEVQTSVVLEVVAYESGNGVTAPRLMKDVRATYTPEARAAKIQGVVWLRCVVLQDGTVGRVEVVRSLDTQFGLDQQAIVATKQLTFRPGSRLGQPVPVRVTVEQVFSLR